MALEQEIKLSVVGEERLDLNTLTVDRYQQSDASTQRLISRYFDTPESMLMQHGFGLRLRFNGQQWLQTVKESGSAQAGLHQRQEWEQVVEKDDFDLALLSQTPLRQFVQDNNIWPYITPLFTTDFQRQVIQLHNEQSHIELAYDFGRVYNEHHEQKIHEVELELVKGTTEELTAVSQQLLALFPLAPSDVSKAQMGYELLTMSE